MRGDARVLRRQWGRWRNLRQSSMIGSTLYMLRLRRQAPPHPRPQKTGVSV